jgi:hypothetical protein
MSNVSWIILGIVVLVIVAALVFLRMNRRAGARRARAEQIRAEAVKRAAELDRREADANAMAAQAQDARAKADRLESVSAEQRAESAATPTDVEDPLRKADRIDPDVRRRSRDIDDTGAQRATNETSDDVDVHDRTARDETVRDEQSATPTPPKDDQYFAAPGQMTASGGKPVPSKKVEKVGPPPVLQTGVQLPQLRQPKIFLCYRRKDTEGFARGIYERLAGKYGHEQVYRDIDSTPAGVKYSSWIESRVGECSVMVVLIGDAWISAQDRAGQRRLDLAKDWVRQEIEAALKRDVPIIPVLVQGAPMPSEDELPPSIADLTGFQSAEITDSRWDFDVGLLIQAIDRLIASD